MLASLLFVAIGFGAGILSGLFGIGGGIVIVPALVFFAKYQQQTAVGTSLGALLLPVGFLGAMAYHRAGHIDVKASGLIALGLFVGALFGAKVALAATGPTLKRAFAVFLVLVAAKMFWDTRATG
ncbi:MAG: sulfite exporter TauE/SafE family protein [Gemmatimonadaceae bacterium]|jgi:hypothetical protein|nr:sulfite exporter TauE/SafE family protein [Gemmatimonadaceae bacterium]